MSSKEGWEHMSFQIITVQLKYHKSVCGPSEQCKAVEARSSTVRYNSKKLHAFFVFYTDACAAVPRVPVSCRLASLDVSFLCAILFCSRIWLELTYFIGTFNLPTSYQ